MKNLPPRPLPPSPSRPASGRALVMVALTAVLLAGCATRPRDAARKVHQAGESVVFIGEEPAALAHAPAPATSLVVRSTYKPTPDSVRYVEGRDYLVDPAAGTLRRLPGSRLPDFRENVLFGQATFDHTRFPGFGNAAFFAFVDYDYEPTADWPVQASQADRLPRTRARLHSGQRVKLVAYGDSITAGGDASRPDLVFWRRWAAALQAKYPQAEVVAINGATGGDSTVQGLQRLQAKVINERPDLVLVGFGMNDHNVGGVPVPQFEANLETLITRVRQETGAELVLFSAFPPNPRWKFGSHHMADYAEATRRVAERTECAYADVLSNWQLVAARKKPEDMLANNINHPNDFGHWIYFRVLLAFGL
ncbi:MAG: SGNH/GDSL hydrolase family protein [Verrucomicrobiales bacterium]|nr:SGNH/GDSL hydrolase family protein [Verrucomicrobiales bacterium]